MATLRDSFNYGASTEAPQPARRHTLALLVENEFGVLARIAGLLAGRGYNIESLAVAETNDPSLSRMTIMTSGTDHVIEQIIKQLRRLINVIKVSDLTELGYVDRELALIKVDASDGAKRDEILRVCVIFRARVVDAGKNAFVLEATGDGGKIQSLIDMLEPLGIREIVRTGKIAIARGDRVLEAV
ncbi:MAG TPA: acetolactate synthase small subunit [Polyangia bacterium]|nr:acetolactate synthase small subunit [Polyangia bacterium]